MDVSTITAGRMGNSTGNEGDLYAPGTGTAEIGGITTNEAQALLRGMNGLHLIGGDVVEVSPPFDQTGNTALVAATLMFEILCLLAGSVSHWRSW